MEHGILEIGPGQLALAFVFILAAGATSLYQGLKLERDLLVRRLCFGPGHQLLLRPRNIGEDFK